MDDLTKALTDYYDPHTDLVRKQHLHEQLNRFLIDRNSWQIALTTFQEQQQESNNCNVTISNLFFTYKYLNIQFVIIMVINNKFVRYFFGFFFIYSIQFLFMFAQNYVYLLYKLLVVIINGQ